MSQCLASRKHPPLCAELKSSEVIQQWFPGDEIWSCSRKSEVGMLLLIVRCLEYFGEVQACRRTPLRCGAGLGLGFGLCSTLGLLFDNLPGTTMRVSITMEQDLAKPNVTCKGTAELILHMTVLIQSRDVSNHHSRRCAHSLITDDFSPRHNMRPEQVEDNYLARHSRP